MSSSSVEFCKEETAMSDLFPLHDLALDLYKT